jgi:hypothetical protein
MSDLKIAILSEKRDFSRFFAIFFEKNENCLFWQFVSFCTILHRARKKSHFSCASSIRDIKFIIFGFFNP